MLNATATGCAIEVHTAQPHRFAPWNAGPSTIEVDRARPTTGPFGRENRPGADASIVAGVWRPREVAVAQNARPAGQRSAITRSIALDRLHARAAGLRRSGFALVEATKLDARTVAAAALDRTRILILP